LRNAVRAARLVAGPPGTRVRFYAGQEGLQALRESWSNILTHKRQRRFFQEWGWYQAYLLNLEPTPEKVNFALLADFTAPVAIVPLQSASSSFHGLTSRLWRLPEHDHIPLADVIASDGVSGRELVAALLAGMRREGMSWDRVQFTGFGEDSCLSCRDLAGRRPIYRDILTSCEQVACDLPWELFARRFSPNFRSNLNKARHKVEGAGGASYEITNDPKRVRELFPEFLRVEASGWKGAEGTRSAVALDPGRIGFYRSLIDSFAPSGRIYINVMRFRHRVIASQFCICDSDTLYVLKQGYDESLAAFAPGNMLLEQLVRWCFRNQGVRKINQVGSPRWFRDWKPERTSYVYRLHFFNSTPLGQIHRFKYAARERLRTVRASLHTPAGWRRSRGLPSRPS
jgi:CelD/BcsL family acetyltransferase involved in cellulose biosynthesis